MVVLHVDGVMEKARALTGDLHGVVEQRPVAESQTSYTTSWIRRLAGWPEDAEFSPVQRVTFGPA